MHLPTFFVLAVLGSFALVTAEEQAVQGTLGVEETTEPMEIFWGNLTATELAKIDPLVFVNVTKREINIIPSEACAGFTSDQISVLNVSAVCLPSNSYLHQVPGFTAYQVFNFPSYVCSSINAAQAPNFEGSTFALGGWKWDCLSRWSKGAVEGITAVQVSKDQNARRCR